MSRSPGQVLIIFVLLMPALMGFLGLAMDGGYYFAAGRATQMAASAAARAAAGAVLDTAYTSATTNGQAIGQANLNTLLLTGVTITIEYTDVALSGGTPDSTTWFTGTPDESVEFVRATASGTYSPFFLRLLQISTVELRRQTVVRLGSILPLSICKDDPSYSTSSWTVFQEVRYGTSTPAADGPYDTTSPCRWSSSGSTWDGLVDLNGATAQRCLISSRKASYQGWIGPPPTGPAPATGASLAGHSNSGISNCNSVPSWINAFTTGGWPAPYIVVVGAPVTVGGVPYVNVIGCRKVTLTAYPSSGPACRAYFSSQRACVKATPQDTGPTSCSEITSSLTEIS